MKSSSRPVNPGLESWVQHCLKERDTFHPVLIVLPRGQCGLCQGGTLIVCLSQRVCIHRYVSVIFIHECMYMCVCMYRVPIYMQAASEYLGQGLCVHNAFSIYTQLLILLASYFPFWPVGSMTNQVSISFWYMPQYYCLLGHHPQMTRERGFLAYHHLACNLLLEIDIPSYMFPSWT